MAEILHYYLFKSRNKDNKDIPNFHERTKMFYVDYDPRILSAMDPRITEVDKAYAKFVSEGVPGELTRLYEAVNFRNPEKIRNHLISKLALDQISIIKNIQRVMDHVSMQEDCRATSKWLFDFDCTDVTCLRDFVETCKENAHTGEFTADLITEIQETPHGYAIISKEPFDTRVPMTKMSKAFIDVTLMRDNLVFRDMRETGKPWISIIDTISHKPDINGEFNWEYIAKRRESLDYKIESLDCNVDEEIDR